MFFLAYSFAGESWLENRLQRYSAFSSSYADSEFGNAAPQSPLPLQLVKDSSQHRDLATAADQPTVYIVRNPLAVLVDYCESLQQALPSTTTHKLVEDAAKTWLSYTNSGPLAPCRTEVEKMISVAMDDSRLENCIHIRIEDFAAFPGATVRRICEFFEVHCPIELIRAFVDADKSQRRKPRYTRAFSRQTGSAATATLPACTQSSCTNIDLFSWVDYVRGDLADAFMAKYKPFFSSYYPEVYGLCLESQTERIG